MGAVLTAIIFTLFVVIVDTMNAKQNELQEAELQKQSLISQARNPDNGIAIQAIQRIRLNGWLHDGSLTEAFLPVRIFPI